MDVYVTTESKKNVVVVVVVACADEMGDAGPCMIRISGLDEVADVDGDGIVVAGKDSVDETNETVRSYETDCTLEMEDA